MDDEKIITIRLADVYLRELETIKKYLEQHTSGVNITNSWAIRFAIGELADKIEEESRQAK